MAAYHHIKSSRKVIRLFVTKSWGCTICSYAECRGVEGNFSLLVSPVTGLICRIDISECIQSWSARYESKVSQLHAWANLGDCELMICHEVATFFTVYDLAIDGAFCCFKCFTGSVLTNIKKKKKRGKCGLLTGLEDKFLPKPSIFRRQPRTEGGI